MASHQEHNEALGLTNADGDVGRPLVVVLAGYHLFPYELKSKLALEAKNISVQKAAALLEAVQGRARVSTTFFVNLCVSRSQPVAVRGERREKGKNED